MALKEGQSVLIKNPRGIVGTFVKQRPGDLDLNENDRRYIIRIPERDMIFHPEDLEPLEEPAKGLVKYGPEWMKEMNRWVQAGQRLAAGDKTAWQEFVDAGGNIGVFVPLSE
jgi:hypothetical protein